MCHQCNDPKPAAVVTLRKLTTCEVLRGDELARVYDMVAERAATLALKFAASTIDGKPDPVTLANVRTYRRIMAEMRGPMLRCEGDQLSDWFNRT
jgi:hypothetical protein